ncbi:piggyBac transposable element-derived protein 4 [Trichonephila clavipes]|nr:piggyBac transposable element-derived protein 4 [Trichonephila clavipes]
MDSESESEDSEFNISNSEDDSSDLSTDDIFSESSESEDDDIRSARMWVEEKTVCPATPSFDFTESPGILVNFSDDTLIQYFEYFFDDSMLELIVEETNVYAEQYFHSQKSKMHSKQWEWRATCGSKSQLQFRLDLVNEMVIKYHSESMGSKRGRPLLKTPLRLTERHFVKFIPPTQKKEKPARKCLICCRKRDSDGKEIKKETRYYCEKCDVGLCALPCFEKFHTQRDIN